MKATEQLRNYMRARGYMCPREAAELTGLHVATMRLFAQKNGNAVKHGSIWWLRLDRLREAFPLANFPGSTVVTDEAVEGWFPEDGIEDAS